MFEPQRIGTATEFDGRDVQSFVLRMRADRSTGQTRIRAEHVGTNEVAFHASVEAALAWLEAHMSAALTPPGTGEG